MRAEHDTAAIREVERRQRPRRLRIPAFGLINAMKVTLRAMLTRAVTVHYPEERVELPPRTRGVIALLEENCTVCMLCSKECPCWCIYIEGHKEQKPGKRKPVNALDRFAIDYGLCMYCGICVEVCPFDALHWSPAFEYTSFTYEGLVHELPVLTEWEHHVLPPSELVDDADEEAHKKTATDREKRAEGVHGVIREADKKERFIAAQARSTAPPAPVAPLGPAPQFPVPGAVAPLQERESSDTPPDAKPAGTETDLPASPAPAPAEAASPQAPTPQPTATDAAGTPGDTFGLPKINPQQLPDGIGPVERGRLKKLAVFQERGQKPPDDLVQNLKPVLDQMGG